MNVEDRELVRRLEARDGPLGSRWRPHRGGGECGYRNIYAPGQCPWCAAEDRRLREQRAPHPLR